MATDFTGPAGATYTLEDATADYGTVVGHSDGKLPRHRRLLRRDRLGSGQSPGATLGHAAPGGRCRSASRTRGRSTSARASPTSTTANLFYRFIETLFHNGVTGGCAGGGYCPTNPVTRAQMAVFLLKSKFGSAHVPPPCTGTVFTDVPCTGGPFDPWIEELAAPRRSPAAAAAASTVPTTP